LAACKPIGVLEEQIGDEAAKTSIKDRTFDDTIAMDTLLIYRTMLLYSMQVID